MGFCMYNIYSLIDVLLLFFFFLIQSTSSVNAYVRKREEKKCVRKVFADICIIIHVEKVLTVQTFCTVTHADYKYFIPKRVVPSNCKQTNCDLNADVPFFFIYLFFFSFNTRHFSLRVSLT